MRKMPRTILYALGTLILAIVCSLTMQYPLLMSMALRYLFIRTGHKRLFNTKREKATLDKVPFFPLEFTDFGHPMYDGVFPCCTNAAELLKRQVEKLPLRDAQDKEVEETSADFSGVANALFKTYSGQSQNRTDTVLGWSK